jgi:DNA polymerase-3 subunit gamma/tau
VADVHGMLGTAGEERLTRLLGHIVARQPSGALAELDAAVQEGVDVGQLLEQLFGFLRDAMAAAVGCSAEALLHASPAAGQQVISAGQGLGLETILAAMQILDQTLSRLRYSTQGRTLAELALVRICQLEELEELPALIAQLQGSQPVSQGGQRASTLPPSTARAASVSTSPVPPAAKKKADVDGSLPPDPGAQRPADQPRQRTVVDGDNAASIWDQVLAKLGGISADSARNYNRVAISAPNTLVVHLKPGYTFAKAICQRPDQLAQFERVLTELTGEAMGVQFTVDEPPAAQEPAAAIRPATAQQRLMEAAEHPMIRRAGELFGAQPVRVEAEPAANAKET